MDSPLERSCLHTRSDLKTLGRAREGYGLWARLGCVAIRGWAPPALEKATNSKGDSEAKRKAKGRKPDAWRSRRGRRAGDPTSKALRPPGDAPSRPARSAGWPRPGHAEAARGWEHGGAGGGAGEQSGGSGADAAMGGGECVRSTVQGREAPPLPVAAPADVHGNRGGPSAPASWARAGKVTTTPADGRTACSETPPLYS